MKRALWGIALLFVSLGVTTAVHASPQDFRFSDFSADYYLGRDGEGRSTLKTVEKLTAVFPDFDQNHGIERAIPKSYDGHSTGLKIESVTDAGGKNLTYTTYSDQNDNLVVRIGDADRYVRGTQVYILTYTQRDVTKYFADTNDDEFYWDTNGTQWLQTFEKVSARVYVDESIGDKLNGDVSCYFGHSGETNKCEISQANDVFTASTPRSLYATENMTVAIGFEPNTFNSYQPSVLEMLFGWWQSLQFFTWLAAVPLAIWFITRFVRRSKSTSNLTAVPVQYIPPKDISVTASARLGGGMHAVMAAQLLDLAVRHYVKLYETKEKSFFRPAEYEVEVIKNPAKLSWEEKELLSDTFGTLPKPGDRLNLKTLKNSTSYYSRTLNNDKDLDKLIRGEYGLRHKGETDRKWFRTAAKVTGGFAMFTLSPVLFGVALMSFVFSHVFWPLSEKGIETRRYLEGLKTYIRMAEKDRIKALQSPEGVEKVGVAVANDVKKRLELYERTLPYAVLFGQEKEWNKQLGNYYEKTGASPDWYSSRSGVFRAAAFGSAMSSFASATQYTSSSSSSSGGSSGGGSSGGGGGGGGGGGW